MDSVSDLYVFNAIVDAGSFVSAAERLGMTPSGVSKRLSRYETRLEVRLLNRTTRKLSLTEAGEALYQRGSTILADLQQAELVTRDAAAVPQGRLRVACSDAFALRVLVPMLGEFHACYPDVHVTVVPGDGPVDIVAERIDVAIRFERPVHSDFVVRQLAKDPWVVCASPTYLSQAGTPEHPEDLLRHRCLTIRAREQETRRWEFLADGERQTVDIDSVFSGIGLVVKQAALAGLGVGRLARFLVEESIAEGELVHLLQAYEPPGERAIYAVYPHREFLPLKVRVFVDALGDWFG